jgi:hypothetical protein
MEIWAESDLPVVFSTMTTGGEVPSGQTFQKTYECAVCRLSFKENDTTTFRGKRYGLPCGCAQDITSLLQRGT